MSEENEKLKNSFIQALFYPAAELLGEELRKKLTEVIKERHEKREQEHESNLKKHVDAVMGRNSYKSESDIQFESRKDQESRVMQLRMIPEWVDGSQRIDPDDGQQAILAGLWQDLLFGITNGYKYEDNLIEILSKLRENEAKLILKFKDVTIYYAKSIEYKEKTYFEELESFGLVENPRYIVMFLTKIFMKNAIIVSFYSIIIALIATIGFFNMSQQLYHSSVVVAFSIFFVVFIRKIHRATWQLTPKGQQLLAFSPVIAASVRR